MSTKEYVNFYGYVNKKKTQYLLVCEEYPVYATGYSIESAEKNAMAAVHSHVNNKMFLANRFEALNFNGGEWSICGAYGREIEVLPKLTFSIIDPPTEYKVVPETPDLKDFIGCECQIYAQDDRWTAFIYLGEDGDKHVVKFVKDDTIFFFPLNVVLAFKPKSDEDKS